MNNNNIKMLEKIFLKKDALMFENKKKMLRKEYKKAMKL